jgi:bacterioferritin-associated ferredoxin
MYTCICNAIRETELRKAARKCDGNAEAVYAKLGKRPNCGQCLIEADAILSEERVSQCELVAL